MQLDTEPLATYGRYLTAFGYRGDARQNPGCKSKDDETGRTRCYFDVQDPGDPTASINLDMLSVKGDLTGHYLLVLRRQGGKPSSSGKIPKEGASLKADPPYTSPGPLPVGHQIPGKLNALGGPYEVLEGSELIAVYGKGSYTGGTDLLLHITPGADVSSVAARYAQQATQYPGETSTTGPDKRTSTIYARLLPPGAAGGYQGTVSIVDNPGQAQDYLYYSMVND